MSRFDITDLGAVGDDKTVCTPQFQQAIDAAHAAGGGIVHVPAGRFVTGSIHLRDRVTLEIAPGGVVVGSRDIADYPEMTWGHNKDRQPHHFIIAQGVVDAGIVGGGTIDGSGPAFWHPQQVPRTWIRAKDRRVSPMLEIKQCTNFRLQDVALVNSPGWTCHLHDCDRVFIRGVRIDNDLYGPNTDGFDITGCIDVIISDCWVRTGDDAIVLKTTPDSRECRRITVTNCILETNCVALKLGATESYHDMKQVTFSNCIVHGSTRAVGLYTLNGAWLEDIAVSNIVCDTRVPVILNRPIHLDARKRDENSPGVGGIRNVLLSNIIARTDGRILMTAADGAVIEHVTLRDVQMTYPLIDDPQPTAPAARSAQFSNNSPEARAARAAVVADGLRDLTIDNLSIIWPDPAAPIDEAWAFPERNENGNPAQFDSNEAPADADQQAPSLTPMHAVWARKTTGLIRGAALAGSRMDVEPVAAIESRLNIVEH